MKKFIFALAVLASTAGCAGEQAIRTASPLIQGEEPAQAEQAALVYYKRGAYGRSADFFMEAADIYRAKGDKTSELRSLVAAAKTMLWSGDRGRFIRTMERVESRIGRYQVPDHDLSMLLNLGNRMLGRPLTYPRVRGQEQIFGE